jgi:hypothetical protein
MALLSAFSCMKKNFMNIGKGSLFFGACTGIGREALQGVWLTNLFYAKNMLTAKSMLKLDYFANDCKNCLDKYRC